MIVEPTVSISNKMLNKRMRQFKIDLMENRMTI